MAHWMSDLEGLARPAPPHLQVYLSRLRNTEAATTSRCFGIKAVIEGQETYRVDQATRVVEAGQFLVVSPGATFHVGIGRREAVGLCIDVPIELVPGALESHAPDAVFSIRDESLRPVLEAAWASPERTPESFGEVLGGWLDAHLERMEGLDSRRPRTRRELYARVEKARQHLHAHLDRSVPLAELARVACLSPHHLNRTFRDVHGVPPGRYHRQLRLDGAAAILRRGQRTVSEVAAELGYGELSAFGRAFKRHHGVSPIAILKSARTVERGGNSS